MALVVFVSSDGQVASAAVAFFDQNADPRRAVAIALFLPASPARRDSTPLATSPAANARALSPRLLHAGDVVVELDPLPRKLRNPDDLDWTDLVRTTDCPAELNVLLERRIRVYVSTSGLGRRGHVRTPVPDDDILKAGKGG